MKQLLSLALSLGFVALSQAAEDRPGALAKRQNGVPMGKVVQAKWT